MAGGTGVLGRAGDSGCTVGLGAKVDGGQIGFGGAGGNDGAGGRGPTGSAGDCGAMRLAAAGDNALAVRLAMSEVAYLELF